MVSQEILKGTIKPLIIKLISENGKMYGYQITQKVKILSDNKINITEGALYPALHKLVEEGILITETTTIDNRIRRYYFLSESGKECANTKLEEVKNSILVLAQMFDLNHLSYGIK